ncbi:hypothetical protein PG997_012304 [Apiospora hydei]|uniref:DUF1996 domain-containing protein n=1 Tax=Apiospora hydei TaxID=1337664 RepID=A0ABR1V3R0_9PEZI
MLVKALVTAAATASLVTAQELMRFGCAQLTIDRVDPLVEPGNMPSAHMHQIIGGNSFNASMEPSNVDPQRTRPAPRARNGTFKRVPQYTNLGLGTKAGMTIYYIRGVVRVFIIMKPSGFTSLESYIPGPTEPKLTSNIAQGFRMLVGDSTNRVANKVPKGLCFRCESNMQQSPFGGAPCTGSDIPGFPKQPCGGGWRVTVTFPSCWDGKNTDSPDHKSHIAYPNGAFEMGSACPSTHPVKIPQVMYEIIFDTRQFNNKAEWPADGSQPFYWSFGDNTGYGIHGDYLFGWKDNALQKAMDGHCANDRCAPLKRQTEAQANACLKSQSFKESIGDDQCESSIPLSLNSSTANPSCPL